MRESKTVDIGKGYKILTKLVEHERAESWIDYTLTKGGKVIAWCTKANIPDAKVSEVYVRDADEYREYQRANLWRYPFHLAEIDCSATCIN